MRSARYRPLFKQFFWLWVIACIGLGWLGSKPPEGIYVIASRIFTFYYFVFFLIMLPLLGIFEKTKPLPNSISESVLGARRERGMAMNMKRSALCWLSPARARACRARLAAADEQVPPPRLTWSFAGPFGKYDEAQLQRGFKIYREVCSSCHSPEPGLVPQSGGAGRAGLFARRRRRRSPPNTRSRTLDDQGNATERPGRPADHFPPPFANELAAKAANGGTAPPDMSTLAKARTYQRGFPWFVFDMVTQYQEQGPDYIAALVTGFKDPPQGLQAAAGRALQRLFPRPRHRHAAAAAADGQVKYDDGSPETIKQYSKDIAAFLMWAAEPHMVARKRIGFQVIDVPDRAVGAACTSPRRRCGRAHVHA